MSSWGRAVLFTEQFFEQPASTDDSGIRIVTEVAGVHMLGYLLVLAAGAVVATLTHSGFGVVENLADLSWWVYALSGGIGVLVLANWFVLSAMLHVFVKLRHGEGTYADTLYVVAWSLPVTLLGFMFWAGGYLLTIAGSTPVMSYDAFVITAASSAKFPAIAGGVITLFWQGHLWPTGLESVHDVGHTSAVRVSALTVLLGIVPLLVIL